MSYWAAAQLHGQHERLALHFLGLAGFHTWCPRVLERRIVRGRRIDVPRALFPTYAFIAIADQGWAASRTPGVIRLVMDGLRPARVPDHIIETLRSQERDGVITLPEKPPRLRKGDRVRVTGGAFKGLAGLYARQTPQERVVILLRLLGGVQKVTLPAADVEPEAR